MQRRISTLLLTMLALASATWMLSACSSTQTSEAADQDLSLPQYEIKIKPTSLPTHTPDGYDLTLRFELRSVAPFPLRSIVQEIEQRVEVVLPSGRRVVEDYSLVEAFELTTEEVMPDGTYRYTLHPLQRDRHFEAGYDSRHPTGTVVNTQRRIRIYPAQVEGEDSTWLGFSHLPQNRLGEVKTRVGKNFNRNYQERHRTTGRIVADDRARSHTYSIRFHWENTPKDKVRTSLVVNLDPALRGGSRIDPKLPLPSFAAGE